MGNLYNILTTTKLQEGGGGFNLDFLEFICRHLRDDSLGIEKYLTKKWGHSLKNGPHLPTSKNSCTSSAYPLNK